MIVRHWLSIALGAPLMIGIACVATVGSQGCTITTSDAPLDGGFFDGAAEDAPADNPCNVCLFQQCSGSWAVCQNESECFAIYTCATAPGCAADQNCVNNCFCSHPTGQNAYVALAACDSYYTCGTCSSQCAPPAASCTAPGVIARDICGTTPPVDSGTPDTGTGVDAAPPVDAGLPPTDATTVTDCTSCTNGKCGNEKSACAPQSECEAYTLCLASCQDSACFDDCATAHPTGKTASQALETCTVQNCKDACGL